MAKKARPEIYFDEHIKPGVIDAFKNEGFKCLLISKTRKYAGRDEKDYIEDIYGENRIFVTSDIDFVTYVIENKTKHAGIVLIPPNLDNETAVNVTGEFAGIIEGYVDAEGKNALRNVIIYWGDDGYHTMEKV